MPPLQSQLFAGDALLQRIADDQDRISRTRNKKDPAVGKIQQALLDWRPDVLPNHGADGDYGSETAAAVRQFKIDELAVPPHEVIDDVGPRTVVRLDEMQVEKQTPPPPPPPTTRVRRDIQSLLSSGPSGRAVIDQYAQGIRAMRALDPPAGQDPTNARSWRFQAAIHGYPSVAPTLSDPRQWSSCRHGSWFFLAWHRLYIYYFEKIIQRHLGDTTWSLPYWDYTKPRDPAAKTLPEPFRVPADEAANPLYTPERIPAVNAPSSPTPLREVITDAVPALRLGVFALPATSAAASFGGGIMADAMTNRANGLLEGTPHGGVHTNVGGRNPDGLMSNFSTAGLDPIFWLHHCNIDRLWDVWLDLYGAAALPTDATWLGTQFRFFDEDGNPVTGPAIRDILVSSALGYTYESIQPPPAAPPLVPIPIAPSLGTGLSDALGTDFMKEPELLGAAPQIDLSGRVDIPIEIDRALAAPMTEDFAGSRWFLRVEDLTGTAPAAPSYDIYVNAPLGADLVEHAQFLVGSISTFGVPEATATTDEHGGIGLTTVFDITPAMALLGALPDIGVTVTLVPTDENGQLVEGGDVSAGRISVYAA